MICAPACCPIVLPYDLVAVFIEPPTGELCLKLTIFSQCRLNMDMFHANCICVRVLSHEFLDLLGCLQVGFASGCLSAVLTNPLDVINTRMKAAANVAGKSPGILQSAQQIARAEGLPTLVFSGLPPRVLIFGLGSSIFWSVHGTVRTGLLYA